jgi:hypothetical protein
MHVLRFGDVIGGLERGWVDAWETDSRTTDVLLNMVLENDCKIVFAEETY